MSCPDCHIVVPNDRICQEIHQVRCGHNTQKENQVMKCIFTNRFVLAEIKKELPNMGFSIFAVKQRRRLVLFVYISFWGVMFIQPLSSIEKSFIITYNERNKWNTADLPIEMDAMQCDTKFMLYVDNTGIKRVYIRYSGNTIGFKKREIKRNLRGNVEDNSCILVVENIN